jgi:hypothetical protein
LLGLERGDVFVHGGERGEIQSASYFFIAGAIAVVFDEVRHEIQNLFLTLGDCH